MYLLWYQVAKTALLVDFCTWYKITTPSAFLYVNRNHTLVIHREN